MSESTQTVRLWFERETELARYYSKVPPERHPMIGDFIWIPRSIIEHTRKFPSGEHHLTLPIWFVEKEGL